MENDEPELAVAFQVEGEDHLREMLAVWPTPTGHRNHTSDELIAMRENGLLVWMTAFRVANGWVYEFDKRGWFPPKEIRI